MSSKRRIDVSPKKSKKRYCTFQDIWLKNNEYKDWLRKVDDFRVKCTTCLTEFTIKYEGVTAINAHLNSKTHSSKVNAIKMSSALKSFINNNDSKESDSIALSEICLTYHTINHHLSYLSNDCGIKLIQQLFYDSKIAKRIHCGRTKMEAIAKNVLCPLSIENHLKKVKGKKFSISSDASNRGNIKLYPIGIQYFDKSIGIQNFVLDFYEDPNETSNAIYSHLKKSLSDNDLAFNDLIAYTADNANVNYGSHHSVFKNFQEENQYIIRANCNYHSQYSQTFIITTPFRG